jgi:outer membrane immunogenic protein
MRTEAPDKPISLMPSGHYSRKIPANLRIWSFWLKCGHFATVLGSIWAQNSPNLAILEKGVFMSKFLLGAAGLVAAAGLLLGVGGLGAASAADMPVKYKAPPPVPVPVYSWAGCYVGIEGGGAWGRSRHTNFNGVSNVDITNTFDLSGGLVGGEAGCNFQVTNIVVGFEGDGSWTNKHGSSPDLAPFNPAFTSSTSERAIYTFRVRLGYAFDRVLIFASAGGAAADVGISAFGPGFFGAENRTVNGWSAGGGVEWAFLQNWSAKVEYLHLDFGNPAFFVVPPAGLVNRTGGIHLTDDVVRVGVNYKFDWATPVVAKY